MNIDFCIFIASDFKTIFHSKTEPKNTSTPVNISVIISLIGLATSTTRQAIIHTVPKGKTPGIISQPPLFAPNNNPAAKTKP